LTFQLADGKLVWHENGPVFTKRCIRRVGEEGLTTAGAFACRGVVLAGGTSPRETQKALCSTIDTGSASIVAT